jgi:hypothetical protein
MNTLPAMSFSQTEGVTPIERTVTPCTSQSGRVCTMSQKMAKSTSQQDFYGTAGMHYMANQSNTPSDKTPEDLFHDQHLLDLQECMQNFIAFHAKMLGNIMYYQQALQQPYA